MEPDATVPSEAEDTVDAAVRCSPSKAIRFGTALTPVELPCTFRHIALPHRCTLLCPRCQPTPSPSDRSGDNSHPPPHLPSPSDLQVDNLDARIRARGAKRCHIQTPSSVITTGTPATHAGSISQTPTRACPVPPTSVGLRTISTSPAKTPNSTLTSGTHAPPGEGTRPCLITDCDG